jgi:hypothetical protein
VAAPAQATELDTKAQLVACAAALADLAEIGVVQREVPAQHRRVDLGWKPLSRIFGSL